MKLPIRRPDDSHDHDGGREFERLRVPFSEQLEHWPDFVAPLHSVLDAALPLTDLEETDAAYLLDVELPGVQRQDVELSVDDERLVLTARRRERERVGLLRHRTRTTGRLALSVTLPPGVDRTAVTADLDDGVLRVALPKSRDALRRRIPVRCPR